MTFCFLIASSCSTTAMYLRKDTTDKSQIGHYIDENGVKVEKQIVNVTLVRSGYEDLTYSEWNDDNSDENLLDDDAYNYQNSNSTTAQAEENQTRYGKISKSIVEYFIYPQRKSNYQDVAQQWVIGSAY